MIMNVCTLYIMISDHHYLNSSFQCNSDSRKNNAPIENAYVPLLSMIHIYTVKMKHKQMIELIVVRGQADLKSQGVSFW